MAVITSVVKDGGLLVITYDDGTVLRRTIVYADAMVSEPPPGYGEIGNCYVDSSDRLIVNYNGQTIIIPSGAGAGIVGTSGVPVALDIARFTDAYTIEGRSYAELKADLDLEIGTDVLAQQAIGIADNNLVEVDGPGAGAPVSGEYAKWTAAGLEGKSKAEQLGDLNVADGADVTGDNAPKAHKGSHENTGGDEISVAALSGLLADDQHVLDAEVVTAAEAGIDTLASLTSIQGHTFTLTGNFIRSGVHSLTLTTTATTSLTLPTTGTLATLAGTEELDNKTLDSSVAKGTWTVSGTWTLPAFTLGGTITGGNQDLDRLGRVGIGSTSDHQANIQLYIGTGSLNVDPSGTVVSLQPYQLIYKTDGDAAFNCNAIYAVSGVGNTNTANFTSTGGAFKALNARIVMASGNTGDVASARVVGTWADIADGTLTNLHHVYISNPDVTGGGAITTQYGIYITDLVAAGANWAIYTDGAAPSRFGGAVTIVGTTTIATALTGVIRADSGVLSVDSDVTDIVAAASTTAAGKVELAIASEINAGDDTTRAMGVKEFADSNFGKKTVSIKVFDDATAVTTGNGKFHFFCPESLNGMNLVAVSAGVSTVSSSGLPTVQIHNLTDGSDMLSTVITIDENEKHSKDAATPAVIDGGEDDVVTGDELRIDVDVAGTGTKGLQVDLIFQLP